MCVEPCDLSVYILELLEPAAVLLPPHRVPLPPLVTVTLSRCHSGFPHLLLLGSDTAHRCPLGTCTFIRTPTSTPSLPQPSSRAQYKQCTSRCSSTERPALQALTPYAYPPIFPILILNGPPRWQHGYAGMLVRTSTSWRIFANNSRAKLRNMSMLSPISRAA